MGCIVEISGDWAFREGSSSRSSKGSVSSLIFVSGSELGEPVLGDRRFLVVVGGHLYGTKTISPCDGRIGTCLMSILVREGATCSYFDNRFRRDSFSSSTSTSCFSSSSIR